LSSDRQTGSDARRPGAAGVRLPGLVIASGNAWCTQGVDTNCGHQAAKVTIKIKMILASLYAPSWG
jgi:hypothetical protein